MVGKEQLYTEFSEQAQSGGPLAHADPYNGVEEVAFSTSALWDVAEFPEDEIFMAAFGDAGMGDVGDGVSWADFAMVMLAFLFVDIFDTAGTLYSVGRQAGYVDENDELHELR